jgi:uncharacterized protein (TIGR03435 family)
MWFGSLISIAYGVQFWEADSPDWVKALSYDLAANVPAGATRADFQLMLQNLLAERFHLNVHRESRDLPAFSLTLAKSGLKINRADTPKPGDSPALTMKTVGTIRRATAHRQAMQSLAGFLSVQLQAPVDEETGAPGEYDFTLDFVPPQLSADSDSGPSLFTAVEEQLGLILKSKKRPTSVLVVDSADKTPTAN